MFTGLIEHVGSVIRITRATRGAVAVLDLGPLAEGTAIGDSVACDGLCLTATAIDGSAATFDISGESLSRGTFADWRPGRAVNLERAVPLGGRLGGHLVAGHVDGVGRLLERRRTDEWETFVFLLPDDGSVKVVEKGSVAVDGVSLTTFACRGQRFSVAVIPETLRATTLGAMRPGRRVHLEQDPIGRWVEKLMAERE